MDRHLQVKAPEGGSPTPLVRALIASVYRRSGEALCCDPRDLAESGFGLRPIPTPTRAAYVADGILHYPDALPLAVRGLQIYRLLAKALETTSGLLNIATRLTNELILPYPALRAARFADLAVLQPHAPIVLVHALFLRYHASVVVPT